MCAKSVLHMNQSQITDIGTLFDRKSTGNLKIEFEWGLFPAAHLHVVSLCCCHHQPLPLSTPNTHTPQAIKSHFLFPRWLQSKLLSQGHHISEDLPTTNTHIRRLQVLPLTSSISLHLSGNFGISFLPHIMT